MIQKVVLAHVVWVLKPQTPKSYYVKMIHIIQKQAHNLNWITQHVVFLKYTVLRVLVSQFLLLYKWPYLHGITTALLQWRPACSENGLGPSDTRESTAPFLQVSRRSVKMKHIMKFTFLTNILQRTKRAFKKHVQVYLIFLINISVDMKVYTSHTYYEE